MNTRVTMDTVILQYTATGPISTQQMLNMGYRLMNETTAPLHVKLVRLGKRKKITISLMRMTSNGPITESFNSEEIAP